MLLRNIAGEASGAYLTVRKPVKTLRELRDKLQLMADDELDRPVMAQVKMSNWLQSPKCSLTHLAIQAGLDTALDSTVLHLATPDLAMPHNEDVAAYICTLSAACKEWLQVHAPQLEGNSLTPQLTATAALEAVFPVEDWRYEVANGDTVAGYYGWALAKAFEEASDAIEPDQAQANPTATVCS